MSLNKPADGGIGRRAGLKIRYRKVCGFKSHSADMKGLHIRDSPSLLVRIVSLKEPPGKCVVTMVQIHKAEVATAIIS